MLVLAGDHIYKMDYGPMIAYHVEKGADITVGVVEVPREQAKRVRRADGDTEWNRVTRFVREAAGARAHARAARTSRSARWASTSSTPNLLERLLVEDAAATRHRNTISARTSSRTPSRKLQVFAYPFTDVKTRVQHYWRDVGTVDAFYEANIELVRVDPELNIYDEDWPIWTYQAQTPPAKFVLDEDGRRGMAINSHGVGRLHHLRRHVYASRCCSPTCASKSAATSSAR